MLSVLAVHCRYRQRGGEDQSFDLETALLENAGYNIKRLIWDNAGLTPRRAMTNIFWSQEAYDEVSEHILEHEPDVCHFYNLDYQFGPAAIRAASHMNVPVVKTLCNERLLVSPCNTRHSCTSSRAPILSAANWFHRSTWKHHVNAFIPVSQYIRAKHAAILPLDRMYVKPDLACYPERDPPDFSKPVKRQFLYVGRLVPEKGILTLLEAWSLLGTSAPELLIVGSGDVVIERLIDRYKEIGYPIERLGFLHQAKVLDIMEESLALIVPSIWPEPSGRVAVEAMSRGLPTIVTNVGGLPESRPLYIIDADNATTIADVVRPIVNWTPRQAFLRQEVFKRYQRDFSVSNNLNALHEIYHHAIARRRLSMLAAA